MPHDKKNTLLAVGDRVILSGIIKSIDSEQAKYCNIQMEIDESGAPEAERTGFTLSLSGRSVEKIGGDLACGSTLTPLLSNALVKDLGRNIIVLDRGFVYVGNAVLDGDLLTISGAKCIRRWGTTKGLGQLAKSGRTSNTVLDESGDVLVPLKAVIHFIKCETNW